MLSTTAFKKICKNLNNYEFTDKFKKYKAQIEKELKVLEIIKNKRVDVNLLLSMYKLDCSVCVYNEYVVDIEGLWECKLTEKEFNLLKEVLYKCIMK